MQIMDSHIEAGQEMSEKDRIAFYGALVEYLATGKAPELKGTPKAVFVAIRPTLDNSRKRSESGSAGGRASGKAKLEANQEANGKAKQEANDEAKRNRNRKGITDVIPNPLSPFDDDVSDDFVSDCLADWNEITGQSIRVFSGTVFADISRVKELGYTREDVRRVIRLKLDQWGEDAKMSRYVRPSTIFKHFEEYANEMCAEEACHEPDWGDAAGIADTDQSGPC